MGRCPPEHSQIDVEAACVSKSTACRVLSDQPCCRAEYDIERSSGECEFTAHT